MTAKITLLLALGAAALVAQTPNPQGRGGPPVMATRQIKPGLFLITGGGANSEVRVTRDGLILVDGKLPGQENYDALMAQIRMISPLPIRYLIVTHHHGDHAGNDDRFIAAGVPIVAQENFNANLAKMTDANKPAAATITYAKEYTIKLGGVTVEAHHFGNAHTSGDTVVYFPDLKVVAVSDEVAPPMPGPRADYAGGGSFLDWPRTLDGVLKLDFDTAIAGNGEPFTKAQVQDFRNKMALFVSRSRDAVRNGVPQDQILSRVKVDDLGWKPRIAEVAPYYAEMSRAH